MTGSLRADAAAAETIGCSPGKLIDAIVTANATPRTDSLSLKRGCEYILTEPYGAHTGLPVIESALSIRGNGATIRRRGDAPAFRFFVVTETGALTLRDVTLTGGLAADDCPDGTSTACGGAITNRGTVSLIGSRLVGNRTSHTTETQFVEGGAINSLGRLELEDSLVADNSAGAPGGAFGAGIATYGVTTVVESVIRDNRLNATIGDGATGGGIGAFSESLLPSLPGPRSLTVRASVISGNRIHADGRFAGGAGLAAFETPLSVVDTIVSSNSAQAGTLAFGAGILNRSPATIVDSRIERNTATARVGYGGGIATVGTATLELTRSTLAANRSVGSVFGLGGGLVAEHIVQLQQSSIADNVAAGMETSGDARGGGVYAPGAPTITDSAVQHNSAQAPAGAARGGGIYVRPLGRPILRESRVSSNTVTGASAEGGGIYVQEGRIRLEGSSVFENTAMSGGGVFNEDGVVEMMESVVRHNLPDQCTPSGTVAGC